MNRRRVLKSVASTVAWPAGLGSDLGGTAVRSPLSEAANDDASQVVTIAPRPHLSMQRIEAGRPVVHQFGVITNEDERPRILRELQAAVSCQARFDGTRVPRQAACWQSIHSTRSNQWRLEWSYRVPSVAPGPHKFEVEVEYHRSFSSNASHGIERARGDSDRLVGVYYAMET